MSSKRLSREEITRNQRWEERNGDPVKPDYSILGDAIRVGDEFFKISDLEKEKPVKYLRPFAPRYYDLQKELEEIRSFYEKHPNRKPGV